MDNVMIEAQNLKKSFGSLIVLDDLSFKLYKNEKLVVCGPSGCGKSTLIRCICGLETVDSATKFNFLGHQIKKENLNKYKGKIGIVFQSFNLFPHLTAINNVTLSPIKVLKRPKEEVIQESEALFEMVGLKKKMDLYPHQLSGGQQQRIAIIRSLAMKPELMLFDEPTSSLDPELIKDVLNTLKDLAKSGMTMIVITHEMKFAEEVADRIAFFFEGKFTEIRPAKEFFKNPETIECKKFLDHVL